MLWRIADLIEENTDTLAELTTLENGKPYLAAKNGDIPFAAKTFRYYAGWSNKIEGHTPRLSVPGRRFHAYTQYEPVGVVGQIVPWNGPGNIGIVETCAGIGSRMYFCFQTVRRNAFDRIEAG